MLFASFRSTMPLGHLQRALDELARVGFSFCTLEVDAPADQPLTAAGPEAEATIRIGYRPTGPVPPETWLARLERIPGIRDLRAEPALSPLHAAE